MPRPACVGFPGATRSHKWHTKNPLEHTAGRPLKRLPPASSTSPLPGGCVVAARLPLPKRQRCAPVTTPYFFLSLSGAGGEGRGGGGGSRERPRPQHTNLWSTTPPQRPRPPQQGTGMCVMRTSNLMGWCAKKNACVCRRTSTSCNNLLWARSAPTYHVSL
jgi:hypothetical protein